MFEPGEISPDNAVIAGILVMVGGGLVGVGYFLTWTLPAFLDEKKRNLDQHFTINSNPQHLGVGGNVSCKRCGAAIEREDVIISGGVITIRCKNCGNEAKIEAFPRILRKIASRKGL